MSDLKEAERLESAWAGEFGNNYSLRNRCWLHRRPFWRKIIKETNPESVLEVGCNIGNNLVCIVGNGRHLCGVDVNQTAIDQAKKRLHNAVLSVNSATALPWKTLSFDLVFTMGLLIHIPDESIHTVMSEIVRVSSQWILCAEYHSRDGEEVKYRDLPSSLFKRNYKELYLKFPLVLHQEGFLGGDQGFDDLTWQLFRKA